MKISLRWLEELIEGGLGGRDAAELQRILTLAGLEVESRARFGAFAGVVVAEVRGKRPHPDAQKLTGRARRLGATRGALAHGRWRHLRGGVESGAGGHLARDALRRG
jgi:hypothetical protein